MEQLTPEQQHKQDLERQRQPGIHVLYPHKEEPDATTNIDIIAVHGLRGTSFETWKDGATKKLWLRDFLPETIPTARVMTFGYDAALFGRSTLKLDSVADALLSGLTSLRMKDIAKRPLIFIGHSMGGLVIKQALLNARTRKDPILDSTYGVMFMAVPHRGSRSADYATVVSRLVKIATPFQSTFLKALKPDNDNLTDMSRQFGYLLKEYDLRFISILEGERTKMPGLARGSAEVVPDYSAQMNIGSAEEARFTIIGADHRNMCRFSSSDDPQFRQVAAALSHMAEGAVDGAKLKEAVQSQDATVTDIQGSLMRSLYTSNSRAAKDRIPTPIAETCEWILRDQKYLTWLKQGNPNLLWICAQAGSGKSVLMSYLVETLKTTQPDAIICYFFYDIGTSTRRDGSALLCDVLHQAFTQKPSLIQHGIKDFQIKGDFTNEIRTLWDILSRCLEDPLCNDMYICIDGFDLCEAQSGRLLLTWLGELFSQTTNSKPKVLLSSLPETYTRRFAEFYWPGSLKGINNTPVELSSQTISLSESPYADMVERDVATFIRKKVTDICKQKGLVASEGLRLIDKLLSRAEKIFLWVSVVVQLLEEGDTSSPASMDQTLETLPGNLKDIYSRILDSINHDSQDKAKKMLGIVACARRPLTLNELAASFAVNDGQRAESELEHYYESQIKKSVEDLCKHFLRIVDDKVFFVHQTARDFLFSGGGQDRFSRLGDKPWYALAEKECEHALATICTTYLSFTDFNDKPLLIENYIRSPEQLSQIKRYSEKHPFLAYASLHWAEHFRACEFDAPDSLREKGLRISNVALKNFNTWFLVYWSAEKRKSELPLGLSSLHVVAMNGHITLARHILKQKLNVNFADNLRRTPLFWAVNGGWEEMVRLLLESGAISIFESTPVVPGMLKVAATGGHLAVVRLLLETKEDFLKDETKSKGFLKAKISESSQSSNTIEKREVDAAVQAAIRGGHVAVMKKLIDWARVQDLKKGKAAPKKGDTLDEALEAAMKEGNRDMIRWLQKAGAKIRHGTKMLVSAVEAGNHQLVEELLQSGADVGYIVDTGMPGADFTPLQVAASRGDLVMVEILIKAGANVNDPPSYHAGTTALQAAVTSGNMEVVDFLLDHGADPKGDPAPWQGYTALQAAAGAGHFELAQRLVELGADPNEPSPWRGRSPLQAAARNGHLEIVKWLLAKGADIDAIDGRPHWGQTAWQLAKGYPAVRRCLQEAGARCKEKTKWDYEEDDEEEEEEVS